MNMKLSYRDKVVFIVVIVILILVAGFFLFIKPKFEEKDQAMYNLETIQARRDEINAKIDTLPAIIEEMKTVAKEVGERQEMFMPEQDPYLNETYVRELLARANLDYTTINTSYTSASQIKRYTVTPANILAYENKMTADLYHELPDEVYNRYNRTPAPVYPDTTVGYTVMNISFANPDPDFRTIYNVIDTIAEDEKTVRVSSVSFDPQGEGGAFTLIIYSINPLNVEKVLEETAEIEPLETTAEGTAE